jgi:hypothetical protein
MFIAALFGITKPHKQPKCPSTSEWVHKLWYLCNMDKYTAIKKKKRNGQLIHPAITQVVSGPLCRVKKPVAKGNTPNGSTHVAFWEK